MSDGAFHVVGDMVFSDTGGTNAMYNTSASMEAFFTDFYNGWLANVVTILGPKLATSPPATTTPESSASALVAGVATFAGAALAQLV